LHKDASDHSILHPLGIPTTICWIIASHVAQSLRTKFASHLLPCNYAVGVTDGSSFVIKGMQLTIEQFIETPQCINQIPTQATVFFDLTNQFNSISHKEFFDVIFNNFQELLPFTTLFYANPMTVHHKWDNATWHQLLMLKSVSQGGPLSPLFASFMVACLLEPIDKRLRERTAAQVASGDPGDDGYGSISHLLSCVDNISTYVYLPNLVFLCNALKTHGTSLGCFVNTSKTRILTSCNGTSPLAHITDANPSFGLSITQVIATFSNTPNPLDPTGPPLPVKLTSGFCLLGHPVGLASFAQDIFTTCLPTANRCIASLSDSIFDN
jgi:hypothetical protein